MHDGTALVLFVEILSTHVGETLTAISLCDYMQECQWKFELHL